MTGDRHVHLQDESAERAAALARGRQATYLAWQKETTRLGPEIMRDAVAHALYSLAERVFAEMSQRIGEAEHRAETAEREAADRLRMLGKLRDRCSGLESQNRELRMSVQEIAMGDDW